MEENQELVKIRAEYLDENTSEMVGESFWAHPLGDALYEIRNIVMFAPGLSVLDIVRCEEIEGLKPKVLEVVKASGYRTIGIIFREDRGATEEQFIDVMWELRQKQVTSEKGSRLNFAFAVPPETDYQEIADYLRNQEEQEILYFYELT